ncbi:MAG: hypothetical protein IT581_01530 [Verrucomicrobiales bacterium]|nr:hypothetical protein [Verrucomicrobiales bacterium]
MQEIQAEVNAANTGLRVEIVGINKPTQAAFNNLVAESLNVLPWLQDTAQQDAWGKWQATWRDVLVLDSFNRPVLKDNLTTHDLGQVQNYNALKNALLQLGVPVDSDKDGLPDDWEYGWFGSLAPTPDGDEDGDGVNNLTEFTFSSAPNNASSVPRLQGYLTTSGGKPALGVVFRRFSGGAASFVVETSSDLITWSSRSADIFRAGAMRNLYNGAGAAEVRYQQTSAAGAKPAGFIRVRVVPP